MGSMADSLSAKGALPRATAASASRALDRLSSFRIIYAAIFVFALLYVLSVELAGVLLDAHFRTEIARAIRVNPADGPVTPQIQRAVRSVTHGSVWTRLGEVRVNAFVLGADGTLLYVGGRPIPPPAPADPAADFVEAARLLPARAEVVVSVPHTSVLAISILVSYGAVLVTGLFFYNRRLASRERALVEAAVVARDLTAQRAVDIERELAAVRQHLSEVEPVEQAKADEVRDLQRERAQLQRKLIDLAERETELRASAERALELEEERQALEELLDEATDDLTQKETEIHELQDRLRRAARSEGKVSSSRSRAADQLARRLRTLYKNLEIDDRAIQDMVALRDETMKLKAEEGLKRLADDPEKAAIRRKVGGLPPQLSIFELGFAGKGRIYYTRGKGQHYRVLAVGAKNTQNTDLEYLSRLSPD